MGRLLVCLVLAGLARPAVACLNDNELPTHEREFRSQYASRSVVRAASSADLNFWLPAGAGAVLLTGACALTLQLRRAKG